MAVAPANLSYLRLRQRQRKAAPPALSLGALQIRTPRRRVNHHPKVESVSPTNMSRDDPPSPPPNPPPSPSMLIELDDNDFKI